MTLIVRPTVAGDLAELDALFARAYPRLLKADYPPSVLVTALPLISRAQPVLLASGRYFAACEPTGAILGAGGWSLDRSDPAKGHVRHVVTDDRAIRRGVGRAIMARALDQAVSQGVTRMECWSTYTAVPFYRAMGFVEIGPMQVALRPGIGFPAVRMKQDLRSRARDR